MLASGGGRRKAALCVEAVAGEHHVKGRIQRHSRRGVAPARRSAGGGCHASSAGQSGGCLLGCLVVVGRGIPPYHGRAVAVAAAERLLRAMLARRRGMRSGCGQAADRPRQRTRRRTESKAGAGALRRLRLRHRAPALARKAVADRETAAGRERAEASAQAGRQAGRQVRRGAPCL